RCRKNRAKIVERITASRNGSSAPPTNAIDFKVLRLKRIELMCSVQCGFELSGQSIRSNRSLIHVTVGVAHRSGLHKTAACPCLGFRFVQTANSDIPITSRIQKGG